MSSTGALLRWEMTQFLRSPAAIFWTLLFPFLIFAALSFAFGRTTSASQLHLALIDEDRSALSRSFAETLGDEARRSGEILRVSAAPAAGVSQVVIPHGFTEGSAPGAAGADLQLTVSEKDAGQAGALRVLVELAAAKTLLQRSPTAGVLPSLDIHSPSLVTGYARNLAVGVLVMTLLSTALMGLVVPLVAAREGGIFKLFQVWPINIQDYMIAFVATRVLIMSGVALIFLLGVRLLFGIDISLGLPLWRSMAVILVGEVSLLAMGFAFTGGLTSVTVAAASSNMVYLFLTFCSSLLIPLQYFPAWAQAVLRFLPVEAFAQALRGTLLEQKTLSSEFQGLIVLAVWAAVFAVLARLTMRFHRPVR